MAYTTDYSLTSFDAATGRLTVTVQVLYSGVVTETKTIQVTLPVNSQGAVTTDMTLIDQYIRTVIDRRLPYLAQRVPPGGVTNAPSIFALTTANEIELTGVVTDELGAPVEGVLITIPSNQVGTLTDATGQYSITGVSGTNVITATKTNYIELVKTVNGVVGETHVDLTIRNAVGLLSTHTLTNIHTTPASVTNTARLVDQAEVDFPAGSILDANGNVVTDAIVEIANSTVADIGFTNSFPGYFLGTTGPASPEPIQSFGYIDVNIKAPVTGEPLELDPATPATVRIPAYPDPLGLDSIDIWKLNPTTGIWVNTGTGTRIAGTNVFEFDVTSFSTYNLDKPFTTTKELTINAYNDPTYSGGIPVYPAPGVEVTVNVVPSPLEVSGWQGRGVTNSSGQLVLTVPPGFLRVTGKKGANTYNSYSYDIDGMGNATTKLFYILPPLTPPDPAGTVTVDYAGNPNMAGDEFDVDNASGLSVGLVYTGDNGQNEVSSFVITNIVGNRLTVYPASYFSLLTVGDPLKFSPPPTTVTVLLDSVVYNTPTTSVTVDSPSGLSANWRLVSKDGTPAVEAGGYNTIAIIDSIVGNVITFKGAGITWDSGESPTGIELLFREPYPWI